MAAQHFSQDGHYPYRAPIDAYGNGGFRFADMGHRGSLLILPTGMHAWSITRAEDLTLDALRPVLDALKVPEFLLLGTGKTQVFPSLDIRKAFEAARVGLDVMDTGAACRTYNVLLGEQRPVMCALIAVG
ncbi:MAG: hypothetical protein RL291_311 [Pseudomonadota bacterium]